jgi:hypothetical protein
MGRRWRDETTPGIKRRANGVSDATQYVTVPMLQHRTTLEEYFQKWENDQFAKGNPPLQKKMTDRRKQVRELMQEGGELWEWLTGTHAFNQAGGLAVVRDGKVFWACCDWRS